MTRLALAALLLGLGVAGCGIAGSAKIEAPVNVYVSLPLSGPRGPDGRDAADGARLALAQAGGKGGSIQVRGVYLDDAKGKAWDPVAVGTNARQAVQDSSAAAYIGELDSEPTRASVPITNDAGLVQVSPGAGAVDLTQPAAGYPDSPDRYQPSGSPNFARVVPADDVVVDAAAGWASELGASRAAVRAGDAPFERLAASSFKTAASAHGVQVITTPQLAAARSSGTVAVYDAGLQHLSILSGKRISSYAVTAELDPGRLPGKAFVSQFRRRFKRSPGPYAAYGYAAMGLVLHAIGDAGTDASSFRDKVRNAVFGAHLDDTVLGSYAITDDGDTTECMIQRYRIEGGRTVPLAAPCPTS
jgi:branched-chain amino acid transport system substrate-binding protein